MALYGLPCFYRLCTPKSCVIVLFWYAFLEIVVSISRVHRNVVVMEVPIRRLSGYVFQIIDSVSTVSLNEGTVHSTSYSECLGRHDISGCSQLT